MGSQNQPKKRYTWKIRNFSELSSKVCSSEVFTIGGFKWQMSLVQGFPKPSIYIQVPEDASLPVGWSRTVDCSLTVVNQKSQLPSVSIGTSHKFHDKSYIWGGLSPVSRNDLHDPAKGYLAHNCLVIQANVVILEAVPPIVASSAKKLDKFVSYSNDLHEFIGAAETSACKEEPSSGTRTSHTVPTCPSSEEVESAKQSLKDCLSGNFNMSMKERLASALSTLCGAETGLSPEQKISVLEFRVQFDDFVSDYWTFLLDHSQYHFEKLESDLLFTSMKKKHEMHLSYKELSQKLSREEEEQKKKLEETRCRKTKLVSDWEALIAESEETKSKYVSKKGS